MEPWIMAVVAAATMLGGCATRDVAPPAAPLAVAIADRPVVPLVDHHKHLISPEAARGSYPLPLAEVSLPPELARLLARRQAAWNDPGQLAALYTDDAVILNTENPDLPSWVRGRAPVADYIGTLMGRAHRIKPMAYQVAGPRAYIAGYLHRPEVDRHFGHVLLSLERGADRQWRIDAESPTFPGPPSQAPLDAATLIKELDEAGIRRAVVLSVAYWFGSAFRGLGIEQEQAMVRAENDWVAAEVSKHPDRLVSFCSVNPLKIYAVAEVARCKSGGVHRGLKLHLGNSDVDLRKPEHAKAVAAVVTEANRNGLAIIVHLWTSPSFETEGGAHARAFLDHVLPHAPDVTVQVAHMTGGGRATQPALAVLADAIAAGDPRTRRLIFDVATLVDGETAEGLRQDVERMRQIGLDRFVFGTDTSPPNPPANRAWAALHVLPLTEGEFRTIANNVAPYLRDTGNQQ